MSGGIRLPWNFPVVVVSKSCQEVFTVAKALEQGAVYYDTLWLTFVERGPSDRSPYTELFGV